jgi:o-succinylbenzoate---CoA ligase
MANNGSFIWNSELYTWNNVHHFNPINVYQKKTIDFCKQWLQGNSKFELTSSGSTGIPKPITLSRTQIEYSAIQTKEALGLNNQDRALVCLNTEYIGGKMMLVRAIMFDWDIYIMEPTAHPLNSLDTVQTSFDFFSFVPLQLQTILEEAQEKHLLTLNQAKCILLGGAAVGHYLEKLIANYLKIPVYLSYGMTETASHIALKKIGGSEIFHVIGDAKIGLDSKDCLQIQGTITEGMLLQTNDVIALIDEKRFVYKGRVDNIINSGGLKIFTETLETEIEGIFLTLGIHERFFIFKKPDDLLGEQVALLIEGVWTKNEEKEVLDQLKKSLKNKYHVPRAVEYTSAFLETATQKIDRIATLKKLG